MSMTKINDSLAEIFKKIGSKENTREVSGFVLRVIHCDIYPWDYQTFICHSVNASKDKGLM